LGFLCKPMKRLLFIFNSKLMLKKFILTFLAFIIIATVSYSFLILTWGFIAPRKLKNNLNLPDNYGYLEDRLKNAKDVKDVDILFLGPSTTYRGFDTRIFNKSGYKAFNFGSSSQTPKHTSLILNHYLDSLNPKLVIYDVYPAVFDADGVEPSLDFIIHNDELTETYPLLWKNFNIKIVNAIIFKGLTNLLSLNIPGNLDRVLEDTYIEGGFVEKKIKYNKNINQNFTQEWGMRNDQLNEFRKNISILKKRKVPYLLVRVPLTKTSYQARKNNLYIDSLFSSEGSFINFQNKVKLSDSLDFLDNVHLNQNGVEKFNLEVIKHLEINNYFN